MRVCIHIYVCVCIYECVCVSACVYIYTTHLKNNPRRTIHAKILLALLYIYMYQ